MEPLIKIKDLTVSLGANFVALKDVDLELSENKIVGIIGPSGAGKTTLVRAIVGRQKIAKGSITVLGLPAGSVQLRSRLNYMTQAVSAYSDLTVLENLHYFATMYGLKRRQMNTALIEIINDIDMTSFANQLVSKLSGGQKQRVSLAIALIGQPKIMVLDEPTVGLDPVLRDQIWRLFHKLKAAGTTLIITSHAMDEAERCEDLILLRDGKVLAHDSPDVLCEKTKSKNVEQSFLKLVGASK